MKIVDLSHLMNVHTPGWVGYAGNQMYYAQNLQTKMIVFFFYYNNLLITFFDTLTELLARHCIHLRS